jgi:hypothetical protein
MGTITFIDVLMYLDFYPPCVGAWFNPVGIYFSNNNTAPYEITVMNFNAVELDLGEPPGPYSDFDSMTFQNMTGVWKGKPQKCQHARKKSSYSRPPSPLFQIIIFVSFNRAKIDWNGL